MQSVDYFDEPKNIGPFALRTQFAFKPESTELCIAIFLTILWDMQYVYAWLFYNEFCLMQWNSIGVSEFNYEYIVHDICKCVKFWWIEMHTRGLVL